MHTASTLEAPAPREIRSRLSPPVLDEIAHLPVDNRSRQTLRKHRRARYRMISRALASLAAMAALVTGLRQDPPVRLQSRPQIAATFQAMYQWNGFYRAAFGKHASIGLAP